MMCMHTREYTTSLVYELVLLVCILQEVRTCVFIIEVRGVLYNSYYSYYYESSTCISE